MAWRLNMKVITLLIVAAVAVVTIGAYTFFLHQMPTPTGLSYAQVLPFSATTLWTAGDAPVGSDPRYELQFLGGQFADAGDFLSTGQPDMLDQHLLREYTVRHTNQINPDQYSPFQKSLATGASQWTGGTVGEIRGHDGLMPSIPGATTWHLMDPTYALAIRGRPASIASLGAGVVPVTSQTPVGTLTAAHIAHVNFAAIRVRAVDINGIYEASDWSDMAVGYGVRLKPGYQYRTE